MAFAEAINRRLKKKICLNCNVTNAFEPSPPLRHDCEEILKPSIGDFSSGAIDIGAVTAPGAVASAEIAAVVSAEAAASSTRVTLRA